MIKERSWHRAASHKGSNAPCFPVSWSDDRDPPWEELWDTIGVKS